LREFLPLKIPKDVSEYILDYLPFIVGTFITTVGALAGLVVGAGWLLGGLREISRLRVPLGLAGDYWRMEEVSLGLKDGRIRTYDRSPSLIFAILARFWSNARYVSEIPGDIVRRNLRFVWFAIAGSFCVHFFFRLLELLPPYLENWGLGGGYVVPSAVPFYNMLFVVCVLKLLIVLSLIPLKKPGSGREMDSMIVDARGHPSVFFAVLEEGSKIFAQKGFSNRISRSKPIVREDGETLIGTLIESFPEYVRTSSKAAALISLFIGSTMVMVGLLQIVLAQYPTFSVGYADFFRLHLLSLLLDIMLNVFLILFGKGFLEQARRLMNTYRFRSSLIYVEAKGDFDSRMAAHLEGIIPQERLFNPLSSSAFNLRYFSADAISESVTPEGPRELVGLETSGKLAKDVSRLKYLPFQVAFRERYPSAWTAVHDDAAVETEEQVIRAAQGADDIDDEPAAEVAELSIK
jgi:hypothetical protein